MKKHIMTLALIFIAAFLLAGNVNAFTTLSSSEALEMYHTNDKLTVVDVREYNTEYCYGHIPCAINLPWRSEVFEKEYYILPQNGPIMLICHSGSRSADASRFLDKHGYSEVYSVAGGMTLWKGEKIVTCSEGEDCPRNYLYFPHIASGNGWATEIAIINTSAENPLSGIIRAYDEVGRQVGDFQIVDLPPTGRREIKISDTFSEAGSIRYLIFTASTDKIYGYLKFYGSPDDSYRVAIPAPTTVNHKDIFISHIAVSDGWWTGLNLLNTTKVGKALTITFNTNFSKQLWLDAGAHKALNLAEFVDDENLAEIHSAVISNAEGIIGLELFGNGRQLSGILLRDTTADTLYYPHIASDELWWTGITVFNPGTAVGTLTIRPYAKDGTPLATTAREIGVKKRFTEAVSRMDLPSDTRWLAIEATVPVTGFELFGTANELQLGGYNCVGIDGESGIFPQLDKSGWTGIALVNTTPNPITVDMIAYADDGTSVASTSLPLAGFEKIVDQPKHIFDNELDRATYISYKATAPVAAFQLNGDGAMLDALPGR